MQSSNSIPIAIVIAGVLVAGSIIFVERSKNVDKAVQNTDVGENISISIRPISNDEHIVGSKEAPIVFVEYSDTECPFCKRFHETMNYLASRADLKDKFAWAYRHLPLTELHSKAFGEAVATECAWDQKKNDGFWKFINAVYERTPANDGLPDTELSKIAKEIGLNTTEFESCRKSSKFNAKVTADSDEARSAGGSGTPFTIALLKKDLDLTQETDIKDEFEKIGAGEYVLFTKDRKVFVITGNMPRDLMEKVINIVNR